MNYLKYFDDQTIATFIKKHCCPNSNVIIVPDSDERNYVKVFTNLMNASFVISDFDCVNTITNKDFSQYWRKFAILKLDTCGKNKSGVGLGDAYIQDLHDHLEQQRMAGPIL